MRGSNCWATMRSLVARVKAERADAARAPCSGAGSSRAVRSATPEILGDQTRIERAGDRQRGIGAWGGRCDKLAAIGEGLELGEAVVLAAGGANEDTGAAQQRTVVGGGERAGDGDAGAGRDDAGLGDLGGRGAGDVELLAGLAHAGPGGEDTIEALLEGVGGVGDRGDVTDGRGGSGGFDGDGQNQRALAGTGVRGRLVESAGAPGKQQRGPGETAALSGRCQRPWRPGRLPADGASKRIAPGRGHNSEAVVDE